MLHPVQYKVAHTAQQLKLLERGHASQLTLSSGDNPFYYPSLLQCEEYNEVIEDISIRVDKEEREYAWLIMAMAAKGLPYLQEKAEMRSTYGDAGMILDVQKWIERKQFIPRMFPAREQIRYNYEMLLQKAQIQGYFSIPEVPCFVISTAWLQLLFSQEEIPPISPRSLASPMRHISTDSSTLHYNYEILESMHENNDYKIIPYEPWMYLQGIFGGGQIRRFTTPEKKPVVQVRYGKISVMVHQDRCVYIKKMQILVSKFESFEKILERIRKLLIAYNIVPYKALSKEWEIIKASNLTIDEIYEFVHDQGKILFDMSNYSKVNPKSDIEQAQIFSSKNIVILNIFNKDEAKKNIFHRVQNQKIIETREKCLKCGSTLNLIECKCKSVYFCSKACQSSHKTHQKECNKIVKDVKKLNDLMDYYEVKKKCYPTFNQFQRSGKVGFQNLGNTCYMNAALQCIIRIQKLSKFFMKNDHLKDINVTNVLGSEGYLACAYGELVKSYYTTNRRSLQPSSILRIIAKNPQFRGNNHQDSQQFLNYFLDKLHEDLNRVKEKPYTEEIQSNGRPDEIVSSLSWENYKRRNQSFISDMFAGQYRSEIRCPDCDKISITFDPFMSVTLNFPKEDKTETIEGYYVSDEGEYLKVRVEVPVKMQAQQFYKKVFGEKVTGIYIQERRFRTEWLPAKSLMKNINPGGVLFFFRKPEHAIIDINIEIVNAARKIDSFPRRVYVDQIETQEEFNKIIYTALKKPILKAIQDPKIQESHQQYLKNCEFYQIIKIINVSPEVFFPMNHKQSVKVQVFIDKTIKIFKQEPKFASSTGQFKPKETIPIKKIGNSASIPLLLDGFRQPQQLTEDNAWYCNICKGHKLAEKIMSIYKLPQYLIIHLKRFNHKGGRYIIYGEKVKTPIEINQIQVIQGVRYQLLGVVNHFGTLTYGHYTAYVKKDDWHIYDDESVKRSMVNGDNAYLLFYHRLN